MCLTLTAGASAAAGDSAATGVLAVTGAGTVRHLGVTLAATGTARTGKPVRIAIRAALPRGDRITGYTLDFGDHTRPLRGSTPATGAGHTYRRTGRYVVRLVALDLHHRSWRAGLTENVTTTGTAPMRPGAPGSPAGDGATGAGNSPSGLPNPPAGCNGTSTPGINAYDTTPAGDGPWTVPNDPCNSEGIGDSDGDIYADAGYWAAEKRPDVWATAVLRYGYADAPYGPWNIEEDAAQAGFPIDAIPQVGDLAVWHDDATMGTDSTGTVQMAGPGGQVAYVEAVDPDGTIVISLMGAGAEDGGYTYTLTTAPDTAFIHHG